MHGIVAAGHKETAQAACVALREGGNAFDAAVAALAAASVAEPLLASLGGGGFLLAQPADGTPVVYDFFGHTPGRIAPDQDLYPIVGDFGDAQQEFHIGTGSIAIPGLPAGLAAVQRDLGRMPFREVVAPAISLAKEGVRVNRFQALIARILLPIVSASPELRDQFFRDGELVEADAVQTNPELADALEVLAIEGPRWFYEGEPAGALVEVCTAGGHIEAKDLAAYSPILRRPLKVDFDAFELLTNPVPSCGGTLIAHTLKLLARLRNADWHTDPSAYLVDLADTMRVTNLRRTESGLQLHPDAATAGALLDDEALEALARALRRNPLGRGGTTHVSIVDRSGNVASATVSNGEGCGHLLPGTGIHLNNFLGEEDLNPRGIGVWQPDVRMASMMAPTLVLTRAGRTVALGSGGSNRLRTAIVQVLMRILEFDLPLEEAVLAPRIHFERGLLSVEPGPEPATMARLRERFPECAEWSATNLFFGGVHGVSLDGRSYEGAGDPRRGGVVLEA